MRLLFVLVYVVIVCGCSNRSVPAPYTVLDSQPSINSTLYEKDVYTVREGDTLFAIAWYSGNDYRDIANWNNIAAPYIIQIGQSIRLRRPSSENRQLYDSSQTPLKRPTKSIARNSPTEYRGEELAEKSTIKASSRPKQQFANKVTRWVWPATGQIIETFKTSGDVNRGIDIKAQRGEAVVAAADGKVVYTGNALRGYGKLVIIKHTESFLSAYAHNDSIVVNEQEWVQAGTKIATIGDSGTNQVKLHFEIRYRGKSLDPLRYLPRS